jgi:hypothetical protein
LKAGRLCLSGRKGKEIAAKSSKKKEKFLFSEVLFSNFVYLCTQIVAK